MTTADIHIASGRAALYRSLKRRNRMVTLLRVLVPIAGLAVFGVLAVQLFISNMTKDFTIGRISLQRDRLTVEGPSYAGAMSDGSIYTISASMAQAGLGAPNLIDLQEAKVVLNRPDGLRATAAAALAHLDSDKQTVDVEGVTQVSDSNGTSGTLEGIHIDSPGQTVRSDGAVDLLFGSGETLKATSMSYDANAKVWHFTKVTMSFPATPGEAAP